MNQKQKRKRGPTPQEVWSRWIQRLGRHTKSALRGSATAHPPPSDDADDYHIWRRGLPALACDQIDRLVEPTVEEEYDYAEPRYALVEAPAEEYPKLRIFPTLEGLVEYMGTLEGQDTVVWPFFGVPMRFTQSPQRYLVLPNGLAVTIPMYEDQPLEYVELTEADYQTDAFLGDPDMAETHELGEVSLPAKVEEDIPQDETEGEDSSSSPS